MQFTDNDSLRAGRSEDQIPVGARFSAPVQTGPGPHPASYTMGTGSFRGKTAGAWRWPPTSSISEVKERVELYLYTPPSGPSWPVTGWTLPLPLPLYCLPIWQIAQSTSTAAECAVTVLALDINYSLYQRPIRHRKISFSELNQLNYLTRGAQIPGFRSLNMQFVVTLPVCRSFEAIRNFLDNLWTSGSHVSVRNTAAGYNSQINTPYCSDDVNED